MTTSTKWILGIVVLAIVVWGAVTSNKNAPSETIKIGAVLPLTGPTASWAEEVRRGIEIGFGEHPLKESFEIVYENSAANVSTGVSVFQKLVSTDKINAAITAFTPVSMAIAPIANENKIITLAVATWGSAYASPNDYTFRLDMNTKNASDSLVRYIQTADFDSIAVLYSDDAFGTDFFQSFEKAYAPNELVWKEKFAAQEKDFKSHITKLKAALPSEGKHGLFVISAFGSVVGQIVRQGTELGTNVEYLSLSTVQDSSFYDVAGTAGDGLTYVYPFDSSNQRGQRVLESYEKKYGEKPKNEYYVVVGYESVVKAMDTYKECGVDNECIRTVFSNQEFDTSFGKLSFDASGDVYFLPEIRVLQGNKPALVN